MSRHVETVILYGKYHGLALHQEVIHCIPGKHRLLAVSLPSCIGISPVTYYRLYLVTSWHADPYLGYISTQQEILSVKHASEKLDKDSVTSKI